MFSSFSQNIGFDGIKQIVFLETSCIKMLNENK